MADRQPLIWLLAIFIGIAIGYIAIVFRLLIGVVQLPWLYTMSEHVATAAAEAPWWLVIAAPAMGGLIVGLILQHVDITGKRGHGVADVIEARAVGDCRIDTKTGLLSALLAVVSIGSGASVGREGPIVHLGATLVGAFQRVFDLPSSGRRTLLAAGVAAAISASFNAPIAGVLFAHEVILAHYSFRAMVPIVIASVGGAVIARIHFGDYPAFIIPPYEIISYWEFPAFALLGLTCACVALIFQFSVMATERIWWRITLPLWARAMMGGGIVGAIGVVFPQVLGVGYEAVDSTLSQSMPLTLMLMLIVAKTAATAVSLSSRLVGGVFSPSLYLGAMAGASYGIIATSLFPQLGSGQGVYAILGMGAVAAAILGAPLSTTLIVVELTGGFAMTIAVMLTVSICVGATQAVFGQSFFHWQLGKRGLFLDQGPHQSIGHSLHVQDFMTTLPEDEQILLSGEIENADDKDGSVAQVSVTNLETLESALRTFSTSGQSRLPVVSADDRSVQIGWVERVQALNAFNQALIDSHIEEHK